MFDQFGDADIPRRPRLPAPPPPRTRVHPPNTSDGSNSSNRVRAILWQVGPTDAAPTMASVLIGGRFPQRAGFSLPQGFGPVFKFGTHASGPYYCDPASTTPQGSEVVVDLDTMSVVDLYQGTASYVPDTSASYTVANHTHTGGIDPVTGNPLPSKVDVNGHTTGNLYLSRFGLNPSPSTAPAFATPTTPGSLVPTYPFVGSGTYHAIINTRLVMPNAGLPVTDPTNWVNWLAFVRIYAQPANNGSFSLGNAIKCADEAPSASGNYGFVFGGLAAGVPYDLYAAWVDGQTIISTPLWLGTTSLNPIVVGRGGQSSMPGTVQNSPGSARPIPNAAISTAINSAPYPAGGYPLVTNGGKSVVDVQIPFFTDDFGTLDNSWVAEIRLVARLTGSTTWTSWGFVEPAPAVSLQGNYVGVWSGLGAANQYDLGLQYLDYGGNYSQVFVLWNGYTTPGLAVPATALPSMPAGTTISASTTQPFAAGAYSGVGGAAFQLTFTANLTITSSLSPATWFNGYKVLAKVVPNGTAAVDSDTDPTHYYDLNDVSTRNVPTSFTMSIPLESSNKTFQLAIQVQDLAGNSTGAIPFALTAPQQISAPVAVAGGDNGSKNLIPYSDFTAPPSSTTTSLPGWTQSGGVMYVIRDAPSHLQTLLNPSTTTGTADSQQIDLLPNTSYCLSVGLGQYSGSVQAYLVNASTLATLSGVISAPNNEPGFPARHSTVYTTGASAVSVKVRLSAVNAATGLFFAPQLEKGSVYTGYVSGVERLYSGIQDHSTASSQTQSVVRADGTADPTKLNPTYGSAPHGAMSSALKTAITDNGSGQGVLQLGTPGGIVGALPYPNHDTSVKSTVSATAGADGSYLQSSVILDRHIRSVILDTIGDGSTYARVRGGALTGGNVDMRLPGVLGHAPAKNLVVNGNNCQGTGAISPAKYGWSSSYASGVIQSGGLYGSTQKSMQIASVNGAGAYQLIPVTPGRTYTFECLGYSDPNAQAQIWIGDPSFNGAAYNATPGLPVGVENLTNSFYSQNLGSVNGNTGALNSGGWQVLYGTFTVPANVYKCAVLLRNVGTGGSTYFDGVQVVVGNRIQDYIDHELNAGAVNMDQHVTDGPTFRRGSAADLGSNIIENGTFTLPASPGESAAHIAHLWTTKNDNILSSWYGARESPTFITTRGCGGRMNLGGVFTIGAYTQSQFNLVPDRMYPCQPGETLIASGVTRVDLNTALGTNIRLYCRVLLQYYDASGTYLSAVQVAETSANSGSQELPFSVSVVVPTGAAFVNLLPYGLFVNPTAASYTTPTGYNSDCRVAALSVKRATHFDNDIYEGSVYRRIPTSNLDGSRRVITAGISDNAVTRRQSNAGNVGQGASSRNRVYNPTFANGAYGWTLTGNANVAQSAYNRLWQSVNAFQVSANQVISGINGGSTYTYSGFFEVGNLGAGATHYPDVQYLDANGAQVGYNYIYVSSTGYWEYTSVAPSSAVSVRIGLNVNTANGSNVYWSNIQFELGATATPFTDDTGSYMAGVIDSSGNIPKSVAFKAQGSIPPCSTNLVLHGQTNGTSARYWIDGGTDGVAVSWYYPDGTVLTAPAYGTSTSPVTYPSTFPNNTILYAMCTWNQSSQTWTTVIQTSALSASQQATGYYDGTCPGYQSISAGWVATGASGGGFGSPVSKGGCPAVGQKMWSRRKYASGWKKRYVAAERLRLGDQLLDPDGTWNDLLAAPFLGDAVIYQVEFDTESVRVDASHLFDLTGNGDWRNVQELKTGDKLVRYGGGSLTVKSITRTGPGQFVHLNCVRHRYVLGHTVSHNIKINTYGE